jgi:hypothetical protein
MAIVTIAAVPVLAADAAARCEADIEKLTGKYFNCVQDAEATFTRRGDAARLAAQRDKCRETFDRRVSAAVAGADGACPSGLSPEEYRDFLDVCSGGVVDAVETGHSPACGSCGDGAIDLGEECDGASLSGETCAGLGFSAGGTLACDSLCHFDTSGCASQRIPASGQTTSYGPGSDGDIRSGSALAYRDNGDGTISDLNTGLMWEKKDDSSGVHGRDSRYSWSITGTEMDGTIVTEFLATLNDAAGGGANCFAGYCDWRIPNVKEAMSLLDYGRQFPSLDPIFHQAATCGGCVDVTEASCSCAPLDDLTTSSTSTDPTETVVVDAVFGRIVSRICKAASCVTFRVRAVRGPS